MITNRAEQKKAAEAAIIACRARLEISGLIKRKARYVPHAPSPKQAQFLAINDTEAFFGGAAGGGKSDALLMAALQYVDVPGYSALLLRRTFPNLEHPDSLIPRSHAWLSGTGAEWSERKKRWLFPSGAILEFGHLEKENDKYNYKSAAYQFIGFDELTEFTKSQYIYLFSRLRRLGSSSIPLRMRSASNPGDEGALWVYEHFIDGVERIKESDVYSKEAIEDGEHITRYFIPAKLQDNPGLDVASYIKSLGRLDAVTKAQLLRGDWSIRRRGNIFPSWDERYHVITKSEFKKVFGSEHIPTHWKLARGYDVGNSDGHPSVISWMATAAANSPLPGRIFIYRGRTWEGGIEDRVVADEIKRLEKPLRESERMVISVMSHEQKAVRMNMIRTHKINFETWTPDRTGGISIVRDYLHLQHRVLPHPFRAELKGQPYLYLVVPDDQGAMLRNPMAIGTEDQWTVLPAKDDEGLARWRAEFPAYRWAVNKTGEDAAMAFPHRLFNDAMDTVRNTAVKFFAPVAPLTEDESIELEMHQMLTEEAIKMETDPWERTQLIIAREMEMAAIKKQRKIKRQKPVWLQW